MGLTPQEVNTAGKSKQDVSRETNNKTDSDENIEGGLGI
jgi:hypothetical protein